ncbi:MAG: ankyrin repeat domain-containing protein [Steroidobacteraceae bacterium]
MHVRRLTLLLLALASLHGTVACARGLTATEVATLEDVNRNLLAFPAAQRLATTLGKQQNLDALPLLLELRKPELMEAFVSGYRSVVPTTRTPPPELEALALRLARNPGFALDEADWDTRAGVFELLGNAYRSRELFDFFYASVQREITFIRTSHAVILPLAQRSLGGSPITSGVKGIDEPIAALLPLFSNACAAYGYIRLLQEDHYLPATDRLIALYRRTGLTPAQCASDVTAALGSFHTRSATEGIVERIHWLLDQPEPDDGGGPFAQLDGRDAELVTAISALGDQPVEAQTDLGALASEVLARPATPAFRSRLQSLFWVEDEQARMARSFDARGLVFFSKEPYMERSLLEHHANANGLSAPEVVNGHTLRGGETPLVAAASNGNFKVVRMLVEAGADVNRPNAEGTLPLEMGSQLRESTAGSLHDDSYADIAQYLLAHGARVNAVDRTWGYTALHLAAMHGRVKVIDVLLAHGAHIDEPKRHAVLVTGGPDPSDWQAGWTPLHFAVNRSQPAAVVRLLDRGAHIDARTPDGTTALLMAVAGKKRSIIRLLVERGADVHLGAKWGITPMIAAYENGDRETEALLRSKGAVLNPLGLAEVAMMRAYLHLYSSP